MLISDFFQLAVENVCVLFLIMSPRFKQKMTMIDFQAIPNSTDLSKLTLGVLTVNKDYCRTALHREGPLF